MNKTKGVMGKRLALVSVLVLLSISATFAVNAEDTLTQIDRIQTIVREERLKEQVTDNPVSEVVLRLRGQKTEETHTDYLGSLVYDGLGDIQRAGVKDIKVIVEPHRHIIRITGYNHSDSDLEWVNGATEQLKKVDGVTKLSWQIWDSDGRVLALER